eukprot:364811-Chlamydomonas_euryale.AAC.10
MFTRTPTQANPFASSAPVHSAQPRRCRLGAARSRVHTPASGAARTVRRQGRHVAVSTKGSTMQAEQEGRRDAHACGKGGRNCMLARG